MESSQGLLVRWAGEKSPPIQGTPKRRFAQLPMLAKHHILPERKEKSVWRPSVPLEPAPISVSSTLSTDECENFDRVSLACKTAKTPRPRRRQANPQCPSDFSLIRRSS